MLVELESESSELKERSRFSEQRTSITTQKCQDFALAHQMHGFIFIYYFLLKPFILRDM